VYIELLSFVSFDDIFSLSLSLPLSHSREFSFTQGARGKGSGERSHLVIVKEGRK